MQTSGRWEKPLACAHLLGPVDCVSIGSAKRDVEIYRKQSKAIDWGYRYDLNNWVDC